MEERRFDIETGRWTDEHLKALLDYRQWVLTESPANICVPSSDLLVVEYAPFCSQDYPYYKRIGSLSADPWHTILGQRPTDLVDPNPFAPSRFRDEGYQVWDAAIGVPACQHRVSRVISMRDTPILRNHNRHWNDIVGPALLRVGPLGENKKLLRPTASWIFDLTEMDDGWWILEAAHALAHLRGDTKNSTRYWAKGLSKVGPHIQAYVAEIIVALAYDLPLDVGPRDQGKPAEPDFPCYGIEVKSSSSFESPFLRAPWTNREALRMDETLAVVSVAIFIEPHPYGFISGTLQHTARDRWCCLPSMAMIVGWETVDVIAHQPLVSSKPSERHVPTCYGMHAADMMPPDLFWGYLELGRKARGPAQTNDRYMYFWDWVASPQFRRLINETPPMFCKGCLNWNYYAEFRPERPKGKEPGRAEARKKHLGNWLRWYSEVDAIHGIIERSVLDFERKFHGSRAACNRRRKDRREGHKAKMERLKEDRWYDEARAKIKEGKTLTRHHKRVYKQRQQSARNRRRSE